MPIQISGLPADILPEVKSMKNKKRIIAAVFTAAAIVTGFMRSETCHRHKVLAGL